MGLAITDASAEVFAKLPKKAQHPTERLLEPHGGQRPSLLPDLRP